MAAASPNPSSNMLLLAALGIGAYYLMTQRARAAQIAARAGGATGAQASQAAGLAGQALSFIGHLIGGSGSSSSSSDAGAAAALASASIDGIAANIPNSSVFDAASGYDGTPTDLTQGFGGAPIDLGGMPQYSM